MPFDLPTYQSLKQQYSAGKLDPDRRAAFDRMANAGEFKDFEAQLTAQARAPRPFEAATTERMGMGPIQGEPDPRGETPFPGYTALNRTIGAFQESPIRAGLELLGLPGAAAGAGTEKVTGSRTAGDVAQTVADWAPLVAAVPASSVVRGARLLRRPTELLPRLLATGEPASIAQQAARVGETLPELAQPAERVFGQTAATAARETPAEISRRSRLLGRTNRAIPEDASLARLRNESFTPRNPRGPLDISEVPERTIAARAPMIAQGGSLDRLQSVIERLPSLEPRRAARMARQTMDSIAETMPTLVRSREYREANRALQALERSIGTGGRTLLQRAVPPALLYSMAQLGAAVARGGLAEPVAPRH